MSNSIQVPDELVADYKSVLAIDGNSHYTKLDIICHPNFIPPGKRQCPNCLQVEGEGRIFAPTGEKRSMYYTAGTTPRRELTGYDCPVCTTGRVVPYLEQVCGVSDHEATADSDVWELEARSHMVKKINEAIAKWTEDGPSGWLTLVGPYGCGKTFLAQWVVRRLVAARIPARYVLGQHLSRKVYDAIDDPNMTPDRALDLYRGLDVLAIDQLDWTRQTTAKGSATFALEHLVPFLDDRYRNRHKLATILIFNLDWWNSCGGEYAPILSRCREGWVGETTLGDLREVVAEQGWTD